MSAASDPLYGDAPDGPMPFVPEPLTRAERMVIHVGNPRSGLHREELDRYEFTLHLAEERAEALRAAIRSARTLMDDAYREDRPGMAHHLRVSADKILHDALAADDAKRGAS